MKSTRKIMALVLAVVMMLAMSMSAFAEDTATGALTADPTITIKGLESGDTVTYYRVLKWDGSKTETYGWTPDTGFTSLTNDQVITIAGKPKVGESAAAAGQISSTMAGTLAGMVGSASGATTSSGTANTSGEWTATVQPGLYMAIVSPAKSGVVYNPIFVAADYSQTSPNSNEITVNLNKSYSDTAMAKKTTIDVTKTAKDAGTVDTNDSETVAVGDTITFTVSTTIPLYSSNYTNPVFKVTDALSTGLKLNQSSITVYAGTAATSGNELTKNTQYTLDSSSETGFTISFKSEDYIQKLTAAQAITITYTAEVTNTAATSVNQDTNTVTINYSNNPSDQTGAGVVKDKTNHYTFDIDGSLFGETNYETTELVKVGVDKNGNEITKSITLSNGKTVGALQNAEFKLYKSTGYSSAPTFDTLKAATEYKTATSDANGKLKFTGLDAGKYYLIETRAPDGYIQDATVHTVEISTVITEKTVTETVSGKEVTYKVNSLDSYKILIDNVETASYTITNNNTQDMTGASKGDTVVGTDADKGKIKNMQGVELPSTGGIGTTIFYVVGTILVLVAGVVLVSRRRMSVR